MVNLQNNKAISKIPYVEQYFSALSEEVKQGNFNAEGFLKNIYGEQKRYFTQFQSVFNMLYCVWLTRHVEKDMIENKIIPETHSFYQIVLDTIAENPYVAKDIYTLCTLIYFEDNSIHPHWNFKDKLNKEDWDKTLCSILYSNPSCLNLFLKSMGKKELENIIFIKNDESTGVNIKTKTYIDILYGHGASIKKSQKLIELIDKHLDIPINFNDILKNINLKDINYYQLCKLNMAEFNNINTTYQFHGVNLTASIEDICRYNTMTVQLSRCLYNQLSYGFNGKQYYSTNLEELIQHFYDYPFLKEHICDLMKEKASNAVKEEYKSLWLYHALTIETQEINKDKKVLTSSKNKI